MPEGALLIGAVIGGGFVRLLGSVMAWQNIFDAGDCSIAVYAAGDGINNLLAEEYYRSLGMAVSASSDGVVTSNYDGYRNYYYYIVVVPSFDTKSAPVRVIFDDVGGQDIGVIKAAKFTTDISSGLIYSHHVDEIRVDLTASQSAADFDASEWRAAGILHQGDFVAPIKFRVLIDWVAPPPKSVPRHMAQRKTLYMSHGETRMVVNEWAAECEERGTKIKASEWLVTDGGTLSGAQLSGTKTTVIYTPRRRCGRLVNKVTLASGSILIAWHHIKVED